MLALKWLDWAMNVECRQEYCEHWTGSRFLLNNSHLDKLCENCYNEMCSNARLYGYNGNVYSEAAFPGTSWNEICRRNVIILRLRLVQFGSIRFSGIVASIVLFLLLDGALAAVFDECMDGMMHTTSMAKQCGSWWKENIHRNTSQCTQRMFGISDARNGTNTHTTQSACGNSRPATTHTRFWRRGNHANVPSIEWRNANKSTCLAVKYTCCRHRIYGGRSAFNSQTIPILCANNELALSFSRGAVDIYDDAHNTLDEFFDNLQTSKWIRLKMRDLGTMWCFFYGSHFHLRSIHFRRQFLFPRRSSQVTFCTIPISLQLECIHLEFSPYPVFGFLISHRKWSNLLKFIWFLLSNWRDEIHIFSPLPLCGKLAQVANAIRYEYERLFTFPRGFPFWQTKLIRICCADANLCSAVIISEFASVRQITKHKEHWQRYDEHRSWVTLT